MKIELPDTAVQYILNLLAAQPYREVAKLINLLLDCVKDNKQTEAGDAPE